MVSVQESVRSQCPDLDLALVARHFDSLPASYFDRHSAADVARHLRLLAHLSPAAPVDVEVRSLAAHAFEVTVVGTDHPGTVACLTTALAALSFSLEDVQVAPYLDSGTDPAAPRFFVIVLRVSGTLRGQSLTEFTDALRERLRRSFSHLAQGDLLAAQSVAADTRVSPAEGTAAPGHPSGAVPRGSAYEGMLLGGEFKLQRKLASGGICEVYQANQLSLNRIVAVKLFHNEGSADADLFARFNQEAVVLAQFSCPQIVQILAAGTTISPGGGTLGWMAMEYMAGGDLARYLQQQGPPLIEVGLRWFRDALEGLAYAHRHGVLHRDVKPHNLLLTAEASVKVSDFGLLKQVQQAPSGLTPRSIIMGTPHYMSPEQALGEPLDERSDIFSLGTTFFYVFSGELPFERNSAAAVLVQIAQEEAPRLQTVAPHLPPPLTVIVRRMMARRREERYQEVGVVLEDLASYERRGLLTFAALGGMPPQAWSHVEHETQAYQPAPKSGAAPQPNREAPTIDLFRQSRDANLRKAQPLAARMRPRSVEEYVGQEHFFGPGKLLRRMLQADRLTSLLFYGPPGTGKTALAHVIANHTQARFVPLNAVASGTKEVRAALEEARAELEDTARRTILFVDEIHRFNKAQQDVLLPDVEEGRVILIGATTQNPFFAVNSPLLSRSQIFTFEPLTREQIKTLLTRALADGERGLGAYEVQMTPDALEFLAEVSDGDARRALSALEIGVLSAQTRPVEFTLEVARDSIQRKALDYDATGDQHYDVISAFIKSMRGSDADAAVYWLARMLEAGEDPRFIARRIVIFASEDVGNADPRALSVAMAAAQAVEFIGLPECQLNLAQAVTYLATAPKSNASTMAIGKAREDVRSGRTLQVPKHLRDSHYGGAKQFGHGEGYKYAHDYEGGHVEQHYLPEERRYYEPTDRGYEAEIRKRMESLRSKGDGAQ